ncbi:sulfite exporter TauE/SafE family protein [Citrifermentans bremense]|uniref:sulfite exporter TauE/SafE family protein n=1 Tax=Citrifermentans bremense TaxID=60035 RepID=UPI00040912CF|nr:sulfite exporter TauE/SafE family protein [Citrifermentans bremense]
MEIEGLTHHLWIGFAGGLVACAHCVSMCGGFVLHLSREKERQDMLAGQFLWQAGRLCSYLFLGAVAGFTGGYFQLLLQRHGLWQNLLSYGAAAVMFLMGASLLGLLPLRGEANRGMFSSTLSALAARLCTDSSPGSALTMGIVTGFLPCPIVVAFLAYSLQTGSVLSGLATMAALAAGTSLPLLALGSAARLTRWHLRAWGARAGGAVLLLFALGTALRGSSFYHRLLGCPPTPGAHTISASAHSATGAWRGDAYDSGR